MPRLHPAFSDLGIIFKISRTDLVAFSVVKDSGFGCVAFVAEAPCQLKSEQLAVGKPCASVCPIPHIAVRPDASSPVENHIGVALVKAVFSSVAPADNALGRHTVELLGKEEMTFFIKRRCNRDAFMILHLFTRQLDRKGLSLPLAAKAQILCVKSRIKNTASCTLFIFEMRRLISVFVKEILIGSQKLNRHIRYGFTGPEIPDLRRQSTCDRDVEKVQLHHVFAVGNLVKIPFLDSPFGRTDLFPVIFEKIALTVARIKKLTVVAQKWRSTSDFVLSVHKHILLYRYFLLFILYRNR